ncbi:MAG: hypothetical protein MUE81_07805 [Thermoflexibacter sp.]|jgi:hypothetical protein|nr:hypothetical protein [Thermoflexibacter sp.]
MILIIILVNQDSQPSWNNPDSIQDEFIDSYYELLYSVGTVRCCDLLLVEISLASNHTILLRVEQLADY